MVSWTPDLVVIVVAVVVAAVAFVVVVVAAVLRTKRKENRKIQGSAASAFPSSFSVSVLCPQDEKLCPWSQNQPPGTYAPAPNNLYARHQRGRRYR